MKKVDTLVESERWEQMIYTIMRPFLPVCHKSTLITQEDLLQEGWMSLLCAAERYEPEHEAGCKFSTWAWIAVHGSIRRYVERAIERELPKGMAGNTSPEFMEDKMIHEPAHEAEVIDMLQKVESIVSPAEARILYLRYVEKRTLREISKMIGGMSYQTIENRCRTIKKKLEERLGDE